MAVFKGDKRVADRLPDMNGSTTGKFLTNDGAIQKWDNVLPAIPTTGTHVLKAIDGVLTWVEETA